MKSDCVMNNEKVLVMGASGFLGSHVVKALAAQKRDIRIFTRETSDISTIRHLDFELGVFMSCCLQLGTTNKRTLACSLQISPLLCQCNFAWLAITLPAV